MPSTTPARDVPLRPGPHVHDDQVVFVAEEAAQWSPLRVWFHLRDFGADPVFRREGGHWVARIPRPPVDRMEYLLVGTDPNGNESMTLDPANAVVAHGVFGDHSVLEFPGYRPPAWLGHPTRPGSVEPLLVADENAQIVLSGDIRTPAGTLADDPLPLLIVHDGPEYADLADLLSYLSYVWDCRPDLLCRVLLLKPIDRDRSYSASPGYARALMEQALPLIDQQFRTSGPVVGMGASLGALAMTHAALAYPGRIGGLFLQSGSFFIPRFDGHEHGFAHFDRVVRFVRDATADPRRWNGAEVSMTCGSGEENLENNRRFARRLRDAGLDVSFTCNPDGHNYPAWRDCLHPGLATLLDQVWARKTRA
jgi:enterochelin esterase-like enzyme